MRRTSLAKHYQIIDLKESYCIINVVTSTLLDIPVSTMKNIWHWHQEDGCVELCSIYQDFPKGIPKAKLDTHHHGNMKQDAIFGVTEPTLDAASVAPHQLKNYTTPIMTWWLQ